MAITNILIDPPFRTVVQSETKMFFLLALLLIPAHALREDSFDFVESFNLLKVAPTTQDFFSNVQDGVFQFFMVRFSSSLFFSMSLTP